MLNINTNTIKKLISVVNIFVLFSCCVQDGDFDLPTLEVITPNITATSNITAVKSALIQKFNSNGSLTYTFPKNPGSPTFIEGYVVSSSAAGNFFKTLIIQDKPSNPTAGIEIKLNDATLSERYEVGRKVFVMLNGLTVSYDDGSNDQHINPFNGIPGKYILGTLKETSVVEIPSTQISEHIFRTANIEKITPTPLVLTTVTEAHINTLIQLPTAQFLKEDLGKTFAGEPHDKYNGFRTIFDYSTATTLALQTSTFASFSFNVIPSESGKITVVLSKDYKSEFLVGILNTPSDIAFLNPTRFDPKVFTCNNAQPSGGTMAIFEEDFETIKKATALAAKGYINVNTSNGSTKYAPRSVNGNRFIQISAYKTAENPIEAWLITPKIDLEATIEEALSFETNTGFYKGSALTVFISSDFSGDVTTATWIKLDVKLSEGPSSGFSSTFTHSGLIDMSCLSGKINIGFRYLGGDGGISTTFQIDNIKITGNKAL